MLHIEIQIFSRPALCDRDKKTIACVLEGFLIDLFKIVCKKKNARKFFLGDLCDKGCLLKSTFVIDTQTNAFFE